MAVLTLAPVQGAVVIGNVMAGIQNFMQAVTQHDAEVMRMAFQNLTTAQLKLVSETQSHNNFKRAYAILTKCVFGASVQAISQLRQGLDNAMEALNAAIR